MLSLLRGFGEECAAAFLPSFSALEARSILRKPERCGKERPSCVHILGAEPKPSQCARRRSLYKWRDPRTRLWRDERGIKKAESISSPPVSRPRLNRSVAVRAALPFHPVGSAHRL